MAVSDGLFSDSLVVRVDVVDSNDNSPGFNQIEYSFEVDENLPDNTLVGTVMVWKNIIVIHNVTIGVIFNRLRTMIAHCCSELCATPSVVSIARSEYTIDCCIDHCELFCITVASTSMALPERFSLQLLWMLMEQSSKLHSNLVYAWCHALV